MRKLFLFIASVLATSCMAQVTSVEAHPIDVEMEYCIKQDTTQSFEGVARCEMEAMKAWKVEVQKNYDTLISMLSEKDQKRLQEAQKQWQAYFDIETIFARGAYSDNGRFQYGVVPLSRAIDVLRQRAYDLKEYYDLLNTH